jgi:predicted PurR-regulated permease PerM
MIRYACPVMHETPPETSSTSSAALARRATVVIGVAVAYAGGLLFAYAERKIILWLVIAIMLTLALEPGVRWMMGRGLKRWAAAALTSLIAFIVIVGIATALAIPLVTQTHQLIVKLPGYARDMFKPGSVLQPLDTRFHIVDKIRTVTTTDVIRIATGARGSILAAFTRTLSLLAAVVTIFAFTVMLLVEGPRTWAGILGLFDERRQRAGVLMGRHIADAVGGYVRGNLLISLIAGAAAYVALLVLGVPYPVPLALTVGLLDIVPLVGATLGAVVCIVVSVPQGWLTAVILTGYFVVYQLFENNVIQVTVYSKTVSMSPLTVLVAGLAGATLGGIVGVIIAIPLASAVVIVFRERLHVEDEAADGRGEDAAQMKAAADAEDAGQTKAAVGAGRKRRSKPAADA